MAPERTVDRVRRALVLLLPGRRASLDQVAAQLGMSVRRLQRQLSEEENCSPTCSTPYGGNSRRVT